MFSWEEMLLLSLGVSMKGFSGLPRQTITGSKKGDRFKSAPGISEVVRNDL
jgi:hypothetical protein